MANRGVRRIAAISSRLIALGLLTAGAALASFPPAPALAAGPWFVDAALGSDANTCLAPGAGNACQTIQGAITKASDGDTINVAAGTYLEGVNLNKNSLTINGAAAATTILKGPKTGGGDTLVINGSNNTVQQLTITRDGNNTTDWASNTRNQGVDIIGSNNTVQNSIISGNRTGVLFAAGTGNKLLNSNVTNNRTGLHFINTASTNAVVQGNQITNNWTIGILFREDASNQHTITDNRIEGNWYTQVEDRGNPGGIVRNLSGNDFGTSTFTIVEAMNSGEPGYAAQIPVEFGGGAVPPGASNLFVVNTVCTTLGGGCVDSGGLGTSNPKRLDYSPWLLDGTDNAVGYSGDFAKLQIDATSPSWNSVGNVSDGIATVSAGGTVTATSGTYTGTVNLSKNMTLLGDAGNRPVIVGRVENPSLPTINGVTLKNLILRNTEEMLELAIGTTISGMTFDNVWFDFNGTSTPMTPIGYFAMLSMPSVTVNSSGLTFKNSKMGISTVNPTLNGLSAFYWIQASGGPIVWDGLDLSGSYTDGGVVYGAQINLGTAATGVQLINSTIHDGGNFYLSGVNGLSVMTNTFSGSGMALNAVSNASVKNNLFQDMAPPASGGTANGSDLWGNPMNRAIIMEAAWGPTTNENVTIENNRFVNLQIPAFRLTRYTGGPPNGTTFNNVVFKNNDVSGVTITNAVQSDYATVTVNGESNWWGSANGPVHATNNTFEVGSQGRLVSDNVDFTPWLTSGVNNGGVPGFIPSGSLFGPISTNNPVTPGQTEFASFAAAFAGSNVGATITAATGTYSESPATPASPGWTIQGASSVNRPTITGVGNSPGILISSGANSITLKHLIVNGAGTATTVIQNLGGLNSFTMENVRVDGQNVAGRHGVNGSQFNGTIVITGSPFVDIPNWVAFDTRSGSGGPTSGATITSGQFVNNTLTNVKGHINFRNTIGVAGATVLFSGNVVTGTGSATTSFGGLFKAFYVDSATFTGNIMKDVGTSGYNPVGEAPYGAAFMPRNVGTLNITNNWFDNNNQAIAFEPRQGMSGGFQDGVIAGGTIANNRFTNNGYDVYVPGTANATSTLGALGVNNNSFTGTITEAVHVGVAGLGTVNGEINWWGTLRGPTTGANPGGTGEPVSANVDFSPWLGDGTNNGGNPGFIPNPTPKYGLATTLVFTTQPATTGTFQQALTTQPVVQAQDGLGNRAINFQGAVNLVGNPPPGVVGGALTGTTTVNAVDGNPTFSGIGVNHGGSGWTIGANAIGLTDALSNAFDVGKANQTITFAALGDKLSNDPPFVVNATASSGLPVVFSATGQCTIAGNTVTLTGAGACAIVASQAGNADFNAAPPVQQLFAVNNPVPTLVSLSPASVIAGSNGFTLVLTGTNFVNTSVVRWNGGARPTTFVSGSRLEAAISAADIATAGLATVTVFNGAPGGGTSAGLTVVIQAAATQVLAPTGPVSPTQQVTLTIPSAVGPIETVWTGLSQGGLITVTVNTDPSLLPATNTITPNFRLLNTSFFVDKTPGFIFTNVKICFPYSDADLQSAGVNEATLVLLHYTNNQWVTMPVVHDVATNRLCVTLETFSPFVIVGLPDPNPAPVLAAISPNAARAGSSALILQLTGANFVRTSVARWNGQDRPTTYINANQVTVQISAADLAGAGSATLTVFNPAPGGGTSSGLPFTIGASSLQVTAVPVGDVRGDPGATVFYSVTVLNLTGQASAFTFENASVGGAWSMTGLPKSGVQIAAGASATERVGIVIPANAQRGQLSVNRVRVSTVQNGVTLEQSADLVAVVNEGAPDLRVRILRSPVFPEPGQVVRYTVTYSSPVRSTPGAVLKVTLPNGQVADFVSASDGIVPDGNGVLNWPAIDLAANTPVSKEIVVRLKPGVAVGTPVILRAEVTSSLAAQGASGENVATNEAIVGRRVMVPFTSVRIGSDPLVTR